MLHYIDQKNLKDNDECDEKDEYNRQLHYKSDHYKQKKINQYFIKHQHNYVCESYRLDHSEEKNFDYRNDEKINKVVCPFICDYINIENPNATKVQIFEDGEPIER